MHNKFIIGVLGPGESATPEDNDIAFELGRAIAREGWITLTGGRAFGVMNAAMEGAEEEKGITIGILPEETETGSSPHAGIKIITGLGSGRNIITVLSSHVIVICGMAAGTASEVALAIKADKRIILLNQDEVSIRFFKQLGTYKVTEARSIEDTVALIKNYLSVYG